MNIEVALPKEKKKEEREGQTSRPGRDVDIMISSRTAQVNMQSCIGARTRDPIAAAHAKICMSHLVFDCFNSCTNVLASTIYVI